MMTYGFDGGWFIGMGLMLLFWITVIVLVIWGVRSLFPRHGHSERDQTLHRLRERYAAGEIDPAEFERARARLEEAPVA